MADPRTFTLIGEFKDGITPELEKINRQLTTLKSAFGNLGGKSARSTSRDMGRLSASVSSFTDNVKKQSKELRAALEPMRAYRSEVKRIASAYKQLNAQGGNAKGLRETNRALAQQIRLMNQLKASQRMQAPAAPRSRTMRPPTDGGGGRGVQQRGGGRDGRHGMGAGGFHMAEFGFAYTLGAGIANPIQNAIVSGFQIGVGLMTKPFEYFANRLGERMQDELSDLKAAGGFFSMAKRQESPFVKNFADAIQFTQENNKVMARLAASLPGKTQDYIEVAKRVSDSVARTVLNDRAATMQMAEQIRASDIRTYGAKSIKEMTGAEATKKTIQVLLGDLTKDTVLAGMGGRAGAGGAMGAYGLPQLSERMISQDQVSMGQMQRYSAIFSDPMIMDALQRNINKINATSKNSAERLKAIAAMYKEIVTPELVERYRRTLAGVAETFNTAILGEETGLFGLGRKMEGLGIKFNEYGQMLDKTGKVTTDLTQAAKEDLAIYDLFRDILVNVGQVLAPIVENLNMIYDPLKQLGIDLNKAREATYEVLRSFNYYKQGFKDFSQQFKGKDKEQFDATRDLRAALATIGNLMRYLKVIGEGDFADLMKQLKNPSVQMGPILQKMVDQFLSSDLAGKIGEFIGTVVGTVLTEVAKVTGFISGRLKQSNKLFEGMKRGFEAAGGAKAFKNIFMDVFKSLGMVLLEIAKIIPFEAYVLGAAMLVLPAAIQGLAMAIASSLGRAVFGLTDKMGPLAQTMMTRAAASQGLGRRGRQFGTYQGAPQRYGRGGSIERLNRMRRYKMGQTAQFVGEAADLRYSAMGRPGSKVLDRMGKGFKGAGRLARAVPGGALAAGAVDMGIALASGENFGKAAAGMLGTVIGGSIGTIFGPAGTLIGSMAGGMIGDTVANLVANAFTGPSDAQREAAKAQLFAAQAMKNATPVSGKDIGPASDFLGTGIVGLSQLGKAVKFAGLEGDKTTASYMLQADSLVTLRARYQELNDLAAKQKASAGGRVSSETQGKLDAARRALAAAEARTAEAWKKVSTNAKIKLNNAIVQMQTNTQAFNQALTVQALNIANTLRDATAKINASKLTPDAVKKLSGALPPAPTQATPQVVPSRTKANVMGGNGATGSLGDAISREMRMKPPGSHLVIANSSETIIPKSGIISAASGYIATMGMYSSAFAGRSSTPARVVNNITINQQPGQSADELASIVAIKIGEAVADARAASIFV